MSTLHYSFYEHPMLHVTEEVGISAVVAPIDESVVASVAVLELSSETHNSHTNTNTITNTDTSTTNNGNNNNNNNNKNNNNITTTKDSPKSIITTSTAEAANEEDELKLQELHALPPQQDDICCELQQLLVVQDIGAKSTVSTNVGGRMRHQRLDSELMCLERTVVGNSSRGCIGNKHKHNHHKSSSNLSSPGSPATIPTDGPRLLPSASALNPTERVATPPPSKETNPIAITVNDAQTQDVGQVLCTPVSTTRDLLPSSLSLSLSLSLSRSPEQQQEQQKPKRPSILRKSRFSPPLPGTSPHSLTPSTGQRVRGLWSPSVSVELLYQQDDDDVGDESGDRDKRGFHQSGSVAPSAASFLPSPPCLGRAPVSSPLDVVRDETLAHIFCFLPLADLLRAGMVSRRWRHEIHKTGEGKIDDQQQQRRRTARKTTGNGSATGNIGNSKNTFVYDQRSSRGRSTSNNYPSIRLWERVDASSFIQETYDKFLAVAVQRKLQHQLGEELTGLSSSSQARAQEEAPRDVGQSSSTTPRRRRTETAAAKKRKRITDPARWARLQTGRALGKVLRSKTMMPERTNVATVASNPVKPTAIVKPFEIRSLALRNVGDKLSSDHLDDFLPPSLLSSLRELTLEGFESLTDTHVHVLLLTTMGTGPTSLVKNNNNKKNHPMMNIMNPNKSKGGNSKLESLVFENCPKLTSKVLSSIAKTCSHEHLRKLSVKGCPRIDSIAPLSDFLVTKLLLPKSSVHENDTAAPAAAPLGASTEEKGTPDARLSPTSQPSGSPSTPRSTVATLLESQPTSQGRTSWFEEASEKVPASVASLFSAGSSPTSGERAVTSLLVPQLSQHSTVAGSAVGLGSLFAPQQQPKKDLSETQPAGITSLFAPPASSQQVSSKTSTQTRRLSSMFEPPPPQKLEASITKSHNSSGVLSLFQPMSKAQDTPTQPRPAQASSLFEPPAQHQQNQEALQPPTKGVVSLFAPPQAGEQRHQPTNHVSGIRSLSSTAASKSALTSLFDLPGTSPTRMNNAQSMKILPPPPSFPDITSKSKTKSNSRSIALALSSLHPRSEEKPGKTLSSSAIVSVSKRYHRHQRSLSNGKLPFPPALLPSGDGVDGDADQHFDGEYPPRDEASLRPARNSNKTSSSNSNSINGNINNSSYAPAISVGSLGTLDVRGTGVTLEGLVSCFWGLTHHSHIGSEEQLWCKVWFEELYLGGFPVDNLWNGGTERSSVARKAMNTEETKNKDVDHCREDFHHQDRWTKEDITRLETVLAMDEMQRKYLSDGSRGISYLASRSRP